MRKLFLVSADYLEGIVDQVFAFTISLDDDPVEGVDYVERFGG